MTDCCEEKSCEIEALRERQSGVLKTVLAINLFMFFVEAGAGVAARSTALLADSLDMLGDSLVYGFSLYVISKGLKWQAVSALLKGSIMAVFGLSVLAEAVYKVSVPVVPAAGIIGLIGLAALMANSACLALLWRHRSDDINMSSVWLCSRNDIIANTGVLLASAGVWFSQTKWPDIAIGVLIAAVFLRSAFHVVGSAVRQLRQSPGM